MLLTGMWECLFELLVYRCHYMASEVSIQTFLLAVPIRNENKPPFNPIVFFKAVNIEVTCAPPSQEGQISLQVALPQTFLLSLSPWWHFFGFSHTTHLEANPFF